MQNLLSNAGVGKFLDILICQNEKEIAEAEKIQAKLADQGILNVSVLF